MKWIQPPQTDILLEASEADARYMVENFDGFMIQCPQGWFARLDGCWILFVRPKEQNKSVPSNELSYSSRQQDISDINWIAGGGIDKRPAKPEDGFAWTHIYDKEGNVYPEILPLFTEVTRMGEVITNGYRITIGGDRNQLLGRRIIPK